MRHFYLGYFGNKTSHEIHTRGKKVCERFMLNVLIFLCNQLLEILCHDALSVEDEEELLRGFLVWIATDLAREGEVELL